MYNDISGIILAGGKSSRMGTDKSFLKLGEKYAIEIICETLSRIFQKVILITNKPFDYKFLGIDTYEDIYRGNGPIGGIHSGLTHSKTKKNFIVSCDMPLISSDVIEYMINYKTIKPIIVCRSDGYIQNLAGIYYKDCLTAVEDILKHPETMKNKCAVSKLIERAGAAIIEIENESIYNGYEFMNMNYPEDHEAILRIMKLR